MIVITYFIMEELINNAIHISIVNNILNNISNTSYSFSNKLLLTWCDLYPIDNINFKKCDNALDVIYVELQNTLNVYSLSIKHSSETSSTIFIFYYLRSFYNAFELKLFLILS